MSLAGTINSWMYGREVFRQTTNDKSYNKLRSRKRNPREVSSPRKLKRYAKVLFIALMGSAVVNNPFQSVAYVFNRFK